MRSQRYPHDCDDWQSCTALLPACGPAARHNEFALRSGPMRYIVRAGKEQRRVCAPTRHLAGHGQRVRDTGGQMVCMERSRAGDLSGPLQSRWKLSSNSPFRSYRYTVAMFTLPYKNALRYRTRQNVGGTSNLVFNTKCTSECRPHFAACGTPDRAMTSY
jgi:hypothetical protein